MNFKIVVFFFIALGICSCQNKSSVDDNVKKLMGTTLLIPGEGKQNHDFMVVHYVDSLGCTSCKLRVANWVAFNEKIKDYSIDFGILFIANSSVYNDVFQMLEPLKNKNVQILEDVDNDWRKCNQLPTSELLNTFLIDKKRRILLVGNPAINSKIEDLMVKTMNKLK